MFFVCSTEESTVWNDLVISFKQDFDAFFFFFVLNFSLFNKGFFFFVLTFYLAN